MQVSMFFIFIIHFLQKILFSNLFISILLYLFHISGDQLPGNLHKELGQVYSSAGELLRHFWSCFPPRTPQLQEKLHKMHETLCRYHNVTIRPFQVSVYVLHSVRLSCTVIIDIGKDIQVSWRLSYLKLLFVFLFYLFTFCNVTFQGQILNMNTHKGLLQDNMTVVRRIYLGHMEKCQR